jgi:ATP-dependent Lon protease
MNPPQENASMRDWLMAASFGNGLQSDLAKLDQLPDIVEVPVLPTREIVIFPRGVAPLSVGRDRSLRALDVARQNNDGLVVALAQRKDINGDPKPSDLYDIGTLLTIGRTLAMPDG